MHRRDRATLDHAGDGLPLSVVELGRLSCRLAIQETVRTAGVEAQHPVPDDLKSDTADLGRLGAHNRARGRSEPSLLRDVLVAAALPARDRAVAPFDRGSHHAAALSWANSHATWANSDGGIIAPTIPIVVAVGAVPPDLNIDALGHLEVLGLGRS